MQPHRSRYWLNSKADERKEERIADVCALYQKAPEAAQEIVISVDEMSGVQALERIAADLPMRPGKPQAREFEYKRHGTQTLIAGINVATGKVQGICGDTRTEADFVHFVESLIESNPGYEGYHVVSDQLNTHKSETLVRFVAEYCGFVATVSLPPPSASIQRHGKTSFAHTRTFWQGPTSLPPGLPQLPDSVSD